MERFYLAALQLAGGVGLAGAKRLLEHFGTAEAVWRAPEDSIDLLSIAAARFSAKDPGENDEVGLHYLRKSEAELTREAAGRAP